MLLVGPMIENCSSYSIEPNPFSMLLSFLNSLDLVNYACQLSRSCSHFVEAGYQQRLVGSYGSAAEAFSHAGDIQQGNTQALLGQVNSIYSYCVRLRWGR